jgi:3',5'-cyclic-AMP phosphodiesterase
MQGVPRILQVSDSHLSPAAPYSGENWQAVLDYVDAEAPDLVIHTGDLTMNGADDVEDLRHARRQLDRLSVPWLALPGNHDIGDFGETDQPVNDARRRRYSDVFGEANWSTVIDGWHLVGIDIQTLLSDLPEAEHLWSWLQEELHETAPTAMFTHRPFRPWDAGEADDPNRYVTEPSRSRLTALATRSNVRLIATGHVHQWRIVADDCSHVWAPSAWATIPDSVQPLIGTKVVGVVEHDLHPTGAVTSTLIRPPRIAQVTIGESFDSPYSH